MNKQFIAFILCLAIGSQCLMANPMTNIEKKQANQAERISKGMEHGKLTSKEAQSLQKGQDRVAHKKDKMMADGQFSKTEKHKMHQMQKNQSKKIYHKKHNKKSID